MPRRCLEKKVGTARVTVFAVLAPLFRRWLNSYPFSRKGLGRGFSLVEVVMAIGVCSFCLLALIALLPTGLRSVESATRQSVAINIGSGIMADLKASAAYSAANPSASTTTAGIVTTRYGVTIPASAKNVQYALYLDEGGNQVSANKAEFLAVLTLISQTVNGSVSSGLPKPAVLVQVLIIWPAGANSSFAFSQSYTPGQPKTDLRSNLKNVVGMVELPGAVDLEQ